MSRRTAAKSVLPADTQLSFFDTTYRFLVVGCAVCEGGLGQIRIYSPQTNRMLHLQRGEQGHESVGLALGHLYNIGSSETFWYVSRVRNTFKFNSLTAFEEVSTKKWNFDVKYELFVTTAASSADQIYLGCNGQSCFYKHRLKTAFYTFESCPYNSRIISRGALSARLCYRCGLLTPVSYGFASD